MLRLLLFFVPGVLLGQTLTWVIPERTRLLAGQRVDLILEARGFPLAAPLRITVNGEVWTSRFSAPEPVDLDCDGVADWRVRLNLTSFSGSTLLRAESGAAVTERKIEVIPLPETEPAGHTAMQQGLSRRASRGLTASPDSPKASIGNCRILIRCR